MRRLIAFVALGAIATAPAHGLAQHVPASLAGLPKSKIEVVTDTGTHRFKVWVAADELSRANGLMGIKRLPAGHGMLFVFESPQWAIFWMKDTWLALDLVFIGADGIVVNIFHDATPMSEDPIPSAAPVLAVLELPAGTAAEIGLAPGNRVLHATFRNGGS